MMSTIGLTAIRPILLAVTIIISACNPIAVQAPAKPAPSDTCITPKCYPDIKPAR